jgi:hypothetical protein
MKYVLLFIKPDLVFILFIFPTYHNPHHKAHKPACQFRIPHR